MIAVVSSHAISYVSRKDSNGPSVKFTVGKHKDGSYEHEESKNEGGLESYYAGGEDSKMEDGAKFMYAAYEEVAPKIEESYGGYEQYHGAAEGSYMMGEYPHVAAEESGSYSGGEMSQKHNEGAETGSYLIGEYPHVSAEESGSYLGEMSHKHNEGAEAGSYLIGEMSHKHNEEAEAGSHEGKDEKYDYYAHPSYKFDYGVKDEKTGDHKSHWEHRDGDVVKGEYTLDEADGTKRVVSYTSDKKHGFNAVVHNIGHAHHAPAQEIKEEKAEEQH